MGMGESKADCGKQRTVPRGQRIARSAELDTSVFEPDGKPSVNIILSRLSWRPRGVVACGSVDHHMPASPHLTWDRPNSL